MAAAETRRPLPIALAALWLLAALVTVEILATYSRLPARELYHVTGGGVSLGGSRALVFCNFPLALVALAILALVFDRLVGPVPKGFAALAAGLCAVVFWPGVVDQANLDAKTVNAFPAIGVLMTLVLTVAASRRHGLARQRRQRGDRARLVVGAAALFFSPPWIAADLGFFLSGVPVLGDAFETSMYPARPTGPPFLPAVHHGHHHGMDGTLLVIAALLLSRAVGQVQTQGLRRAISGYLALMLCYGAGNILNDFWTEQIDKRKLTAWRVPDVLEPRASTAWGVILAAAVLVWLASAWPAGKT